jgi:hypothetical protein
MCEKWMSFYDKIILKEPLANLGDGLFKVRNKWKRCVKKIHPLLVDSKYIYDVGKQNILISLYSTVMFYKEPHPVITKGYDGRKIVLFITTT